MGSFYRTLSKHVILIVASAISTDLLAKGRHFIHQGKNDLLKLEAAKIAKVYTMGVRLSLWY